MFLCFRRAFWGFDLFAAHLKIVGKYRQASTARLDTHDVHVFSEVTTTKAPSATYSAVPDGPIAGIFSRIRKRLPVHIPKLLIDGRALSQRILDG
jgi:hypothetical protein